MAQWHNPSGRPLSSASWLETHHRAKLAERESFVKAIVATNPKRVVDLGCGPGHWLDLFDKYAQSDCELIGLDADATAIDLASANASRRRRNATFRVLDLERDSDQIPDADVFLAFNVFSYLKLPKDLLRVLAAKCQSTGMVIVRQYDGGMFRFGPIDARRRQHIEASLWASTAYSSQFNHYDLDRVYQALFDSGFSKKEVKFETFSRNAPYSSDFLPYLRNSLEWVLDNVGEEASKMLEEWYESHLSEGINLPSYFTEVDLIAWLS